MSTTKPAQSTPCTYATEKTISELAATACEIIDAVDASEDPVGYIAQSVTALPARFGVVVYVGSQTYVAAGGDHTALRRWQQFYNGLACQPLKHCAITFFVKPRSVLRALPPIKNHCLPGARKLGQQS